MKRTMLALLAATLALPAAAIKVISLDSPGVLEAIERENPDHHNRIVGILAASKAMPCERDHLEQARIAYDAREAACSVLLKTSHPAKRRITFTLDGQPYAATIQMTSLERHVKVPK